MDIYLTSNDLKIHEFSRLRTSVNLSLLPPEQIERALKNSLYTVCARCQGEVIGMGRLVGDGAYVYYLQNINVDPKYQGQGIGRMIINNLINYIKTNKLSNTNVMVLLMSSKGSEQFYEKFGFRSRPNDSEGCGMIMNL